MKCKYHLFIASFTVNIKNKAKNKTIITFIGKLT